ncbi:MAG TPA: glutathione S-transferase family protein, partial [Sphingomicrobium sp.]|nr:glutathione S-transferase family protein [Sphingomicrobium sp.]
EEVGQPYDTEILDYASTMKAEPYLSINPMGKVPAIRHRGKVVTECAAICAYLADAFPDAGLGPHDDEKADYYRWLFFAAGPLDQAVTNNFMGFKPSEEQGRMAGYGNYDLAVNALAGHLEGREFVCGPRLTAADVYVGSSVMWGTQFGTLPALDAFTAYAKRLSARDAYKRGKEIDNQLIAEMQAAN